MDTSSITVQAQYSFKGSNNDELCFKKGDIITLTQREEGGWWEGTLGDKTGWFPSNYVKDYAGPLPLSETIRPPEEIQAFRSVVFRDLLESEKAHVAELRGLVENFLEPLETSQILSANEYTQLMCNFLEVVEMHEEFLQTLEESNDRVGKMFLSKAPTMKKVHQSYCAAHPRAIVIVDKFREELNVFMEKQGAAKPGLLVLTTGLSKPFRRVDKYAAILQELERHMESGHPDRGDTQRSIAVYKDIASSCSATRRQKELELQILTGPVRGWQGAELSTLGDIIHMGSVAVGPEHKDRYLVLFPQTLLILSVSQRMSAFKYEGKLPLTGINVTRLEDTDLIKNAFEISGTLIDRIVAVCQGPNEANRWVELLDSKSGGVADQQQQQQVDLKRNVSSSAVNIPQPPPHKTKQLALDSRGYSTRVSVCAYGGSDHWCSKYGTDFEVTYPPAHYPSTAPYAELTSYFRQLFRAGKLSRYVVQALLYPQVTQTFDRQHVVMRRRRHKTSVRMQRREKEAVTAAATRQEGAEVSSRNGQTASRHKSSSNSDCSHSSSESSGSCVSSGCSRDRSNLERQNAIDYLEGDDEAYETITFFAGKTRSSREGSEPSSTVYESYTNSHSDHADHSQGTKYNEENFTDMRQESDERRSEMIGSAAVPCLRLNDYDSVASNDPHGDGGGGGHSRREGSSGIHTSTARLLLGELKQQCSEQSQMSSFEHRVPHGRMACEDLLNIDESMKIKHSLQQKTIAEERHSMPTYFVGNRFNNSSVTEIYIPSWKEDCCQGDGQGGGGTTTNGVSSGTSPPNRTSVHSSSLDIPATASTVIPVPDTVAVELLYNFAANDGQTVGCLSREQSPFRKHSINSDKRIVLNPTHHRKAKDNSQQPNCSTSGSNDPIGKDGNGTVAADSRMSKCLPQEGPSLQNKARRCVSYQYVQLHPSGVNSLPKLSIDSNNNRTSKHGHDGSCGSVPSDASSRAHCTNHEDDINRETPRSRYRSPESISYHNCRFCNGCVSRGHSPHSSDSGMAGSCTISSPDGPPKFSGDSLLCDYAEQRALNDDDEVVAPRQESNRMFRDCNVAERPTQETPQATAVAEPPCCYSLRQSRSSHNLGRFALLRDSEFDYTDSGQYDHQNDNDLFHPDGVAVLSPPQSATITTDRLVIEPQTDVASVAIYDRSLRSHSEDRVVSSSFSSYSNMVDGGIGAGEPRHYCGRSRIVVNLYDRTTPGSVPPEAAPGITYKTGLYAHWWKKEKLPIFVVTNQEPLKLPPASGLLMPRYRASPLSPTARYGNTTSDNQHTLQEQQPQERQPQQQAQLAPQPSFPLRPTISSNSTIDAARGSGKSMSPPSGSTGNSHPSRSGSSSIAQHMSQHKRSQSFNHHLSYNQLQQQQQQQQHIQQQQLKQHPPNQSLLPSLNSSNINRPEANLVPAVAGNQKSFSEKANWNITNLRPSSPLRPALLSMVATGSGAGSGGGRSATVSITGSIGGAVAGSCVGGGSNSTGSGGSFNHTDSAHHSMSFSPSSSKVSPTYEEDALVLRVIEAYCAAYQSTSRNTMHAALLPWTPCLPIRGGKLKTSKHFSSSNPQLPFTCSSLSSYLPTGGGGGIKNSRTHTSTNSINSSHIWREANPNSFNLYAASIATLNSGQQQFQQQHHQQQQKQKRARYSIGGYGSTEWRSNSEESNRGGPRAGNTAKTAVPSTSAFHNPIARSGSNYDNIFMNANTNTPLLSRVSKQQTVWTNANAGSHLHHHHHHHQQHQPRYRTTSREPDVLLPERDTSPPPPAPEGGYIGGGFMGIGRSSAASAIGSQSNASSLYDRRLNRSFETAQGLNRNSKISQLRRSTPQLNGVDETRTRNGHGVDHDDDTAVLAGRSGLEEDNLRDDMSRNSVSCCNKLWMFYWQQHR
ncbi:hypothetical protein AND_009078 [Anopheles darlingi]|uniref:Guanine nucleotide exchange factor n=1 Tax=Anopheles darlingi TaxID=43151 RepID=W5J5N9_ANODA|nr:hypothetical protein AND_009078 [Anopheles darlingi]